MTLTQQLDQMRESSAQRIPEAARAVMKRAQEKLAASGIQDQAIKPGAAAPLFDLPDADGQSFSLDGLIKQGWLILSFYRGVW